MTTKRNSGKKVVADNPKARYDFEILERLEAGLVLVGTEVKSLRAGNATIKEAWIRIIGAEAFVCSMHISPYEQGNVFNHEPLRDRKLLLHSHQIQDLKVHIERKGNTVVPLSLYFSEGRAKLAIGIARGKQKVDKRNTISDRDVKRQIDRELKMRQR